MPANQKIPDHANQRATDVSNKTKRKHVDDHRRITDEHIRIVDPITEATASGDHLSDHQRKPRDAHADLQPRKYEWHCPWNDDVAKHLPVRCSKAPCCTNVGLVD